MKAPLPDYPAAHSMDTEWFAVDAAGHVGRFWSSEDGAVPYASAKGGSEHAESIDTVALEAILLARALHEGANLELPAPTDTWMLPPFTRADRPVLVLRAPGEDDSSVEDGSAPSSYRDTLRAQYMRDPEASYRDLLESGEFVLVQATAPVVLLATKALAPERLETLRKRPLLASMLSSDMLSEMLSLGERREHFGVFFYGHDYDAGPGGYARVTAPTSPIRVSDLPEAIRSEVTKLALPVAFPDTERLHLADHMTDAQTHIWGDRSLRETPQAAAAQRTPPRPRRRKLEPSFYVGLALLVALFAILIAMALRKHAAKPPVRSDPYGTRAPRY